MLLCYKLYHNNFTINFFFLVMSHLQFSSTCCTPLNPPLMTIVSSFSNSWKPYQSQWEDLKEDFELSKYQPFPKIVEELKRLSAEKTGKDNFLKKYIFSIGKTFESRDIFAFEIQRSKTNFEKKKTIVIECGAHAREWISVSTCMYLISKFSSGCCEELLTKFKWVFIPVLNPDGYVYTWKNNNTRMWRKNRSFTTEQYKVYEETGKDLCLGVDLNRNFDISWGGASAPRKSSCFEMYPGSKPFSENETQSLANYLNKTKHDVIAYVSLHNYGQSWMTPFGFTKNKPDGFNELIRVATLATERIKEFSNIKYRVGTSYEKLYPNSGSSVDWAYQKLGIPYTYLIEMMPNAKVKLKQAFLSPPWMMIENCKNIFVGIEVMAMNIKLN